jgi:integrase
MTRFMADKILKKACERIGVVGVSTHSFRRTALTQMSSAGIPLRHIQEISGHNDLEPCSDIWKSRQTKEKKLSLLLAGSCSEEKRKYLNLLIRLYF